MLHFLNKRELYENHAPPKICDFFDEEHLVESLRNTETLVGHSGCVNTLKWNQSGDILASGSDDRTIRIWKRGELDHKITTNHTANIFAVEFLPAKRDQVVVTGAGDNMIMMHHIEYGNDCSWTADDRVKRMCTVQNDPFLFWAASEDGTVREIDSRTNQMSTLLSHDVTRQPVKSMAISEAKPHLMAVAMDQTGVPIYDRRNFSEPILNLIPNDPSSGSMYATHVAFNKNGTECIVNQGTGSVFVYDLDEKNDPQIMEKFEEEMNVDGEIDAIGQDSLGHDELRKTGSNMLKEKRYSTAADFYLGLQNQNFENRNMRSIAYSNRGISLLCRRQRGDSYECIRECIKALHIHPGNSKALWRLCKAFLLLEQYESAKKCIDQFKKRFPNDNSVRKLEREITGVELINTPEMTKKEGFIDYKERYHGAFNYQTDIKEANFFGTDDQFIVAGSDCGTMYIWSREKGILMGGWKGDEHILNIVQPNPQLFMLATSGIEDVIKLWEPNFQESENDEENTDRIKNPLDHDGDQERNLSRIHMNILAHSALRENPQCATS